MSNFWLDVDKMENTTLTDEQFQELLWMMAQLNHIPTQIEKVQMWKKVYYKI